MDAFPFGVNEKVLMVLVYDPARMRMDCAAALVATMITRTEEESGCVKTRSRGYELESFELKKVASSKVGSSEGVRAAVRLLVNNNGELG